MNSLGDIIAHNIEQKINKGIKDAKQDGFMVLSPSDEEIIIKSRIHPWRNHHKGKKMQKVAIKKLQKQIGGDFIENVFNEPELRFDTSNIKSARCNSNPSVFAFNEWVEVITIKNDGTVIVPIELLELFQSEFPSISFKGEANKWEFVGFTGAYPCLCGGDTILKNGDITIKTKIIKHSVTEWIIEVPSVLKNVELPSEIFEWDKQSTDCCGGCD